MATQATLGYVCRNGESPLQSPVAKVMSNTPILQLPVSPMHLPSGRRRIEISVGQNEAPHSSRSSSGLTEETILMEDRQSHDHSLKVLIFSHSAVLSNTVKAQLQLPAGVTMEQVCMSYIGTLCNDTKGAVVYDIAGHGWTSSFALTNNALRRSTLTAVPLNQKSEMKRTLAEVLGQEQSCGGNTVTLHAYHVVDYDCFFRCAGNLSGTELGGIGVKLPPPEPISAPEGWARQWSGNPPKVFGI